ncbi:MAG: hypothetical protein EZS28_033465, partial [Streblomastix strix]
SIKGSTHIAMAGVYQTDYKPLKRAVSDVNGYGKINVVDNWHINSIFDGMKSMSWVYDVTSFTSFSGMIQINRTDTPEVIVNQGSGFYPMGLCDFSGSYLIELQSQESNQNNITSNGLPISYIDSVIMKHYTFLLVPIPQSVFQQYAVTEESRDQLLALAYTPYDIDAFKIYTIDDIINKLVMFNMHLRQKGFIETKQYIHGMSESIDPKRILLFPVLILYDFNIDAIQDIPSAYLTVGYTDNPGTKWASQHQYKPTKPFIDALDPPIVSNGLQAASSGSDAIYASNAQD